MPHFVMGDQTRIRQILVNLTSNAEKFTEKGFVAVTVTVTKRFVDLDTNKQMVPIYQYAAYAYSSTGCSFIPS